MKPGHPSLELGPVEAEDVGYVLRLEHVNLTEGDRAIHRFI
jgi:hypothetical protein